MYLPVARFSSPSLPLADENHVNQLSDHDGQVTDVPSLSKSLELKVEAPNTGNVDCLLAVLLLNPVAVRDNWKQSSMLLAQI